MMFVEEKYYVTVMMDVTAIEKRMICVPAQQVTRGGAACCNLNAHFVVYHAVMCSQTQRDAKKQHVQGVVVGDGWRSK